MKTVQQISGHPTGSDKTIIEHLAEEVTTVAHCWKIVRKDGTILGFTDADIDITFDDGDGNDVTYVSIVGHTTSAIVTATGLEVDNVEIMSFLSSDYISEADLMAGLYDGALLNIYLVNYKDLTQGYLILAGGWKFGEATLQDYQFKVQVESKTKLLEQKVGEIFSPTCRAEFGDGRCKVKTQPEALDDYWLPFTEYTLPKTIRFADEEGNRVWTNRRYVLVQTGRSGTKCPFKPYTVEQDGTIRPENYAVNDPDPENSIIDDGGKGATGYAVMKSPPNNDQVDHVEMIDQGEGYVSASVEFIGDVAEGGHFATGTPIINPNTHKITEVTITDSGDGYILPPKVKFTDTGGCKWRVEYADLVYRYPNTYYYNNKRGYGAEICRVAANPYNNRRYKLTTQGKSGSGTPSWNTTIGGTTTDGTVVWTCEKACYITNGVVSSLGSDAYRIFIDSNRPETTTDWFSYGYVIWKALRVNGSACANAGRKMEIKDYDGAGKFTLFLAMPNAIAIGDQFYAFVGCNKTKGDCQSKFDNYLNFRGEPYVPGTDELLMHKKK
jgi:hypothetical protein